MTSYQWDRCMALVDQLLQMEDCEWFRHPVKETEAPGYFDVVSNPMDLSTLKARLQKRVYATLADFYKDLRTIWANCRLYNEPESTIVGVADRLTQLCRDEYRKIFRRQYAPKNDDSSAKGASDSNRILARTPVFSSGLRRIPKLNSSPTCTDKQSHEIVVRPPPWLERDNEFRKLIAAKKNGRGGFSNLTMKEGAYQALRDASKPTNAQDLADLMIRKHRWVTTSGATPANSIHAQLKQEINNLGKKSPFMLASAGHFWLWRRAATLDRKSSAATTQSHETKSHRHQNQTAPILPHRHKVSAKAAHCLSFHAAIAQISAPPPAPPAASKPTITPFERDHGMIMFPNSKIKFIPKDTEHKWLCFRKSTIPGAGLGLFLREGFRLEKDTIFCEYRGEVHELNDDTANCFRPYVVQSFARGSLCATSSSSNNGGLTPSFPEAPNGATTVAKSVTSSAPAGTIPIGVNGVDSEGNILSLAPLANDAGPVFGNTLYVDFWEVPGRVFLQASKLIKGGQEIFVVYGNEYWNLPRYPASWLDLHRWGQLAKYANDRAQKQPQQSPNRRTEPLTLKGEEKGSCKQETENVELTSSENHIDGSSVQPAPQESSAQLQAADSLCDPDADALYGEHCDVRCELCHAAFPRRVLGVHLYYCRLEHGLPQPQQPETSEPPLSVAATCDAQNTCTPSIPPALKPEPVELKELPIHINEEPQEIIRKPLASFDLSRHPEPEPQIILRRVPSSSSSGQLPKTEPGPIDAKRPAYETIYTQLQKGDMVYYLVEEEFENDKIEGHNPNNVNSKKRRERKEPERDDDDAEYNPSGGGSKKRPKKRVKTNSSSSSQITASGSPSSSPCGDVSSAESDSFSSEGSSKGSSGFHASGIAL